VAAQLHDPGGSDNPDEQYAADSGDHQRYAEPSKP
jgi:hypothetical protein